jgi:hypothetical protein
MSQNVQEQPSDKAKQMTIVIDTALDATVDPYLRFYAKTAITPLSCAIHPLTEFEFGDADETYVVSVEDDTVKISTDDTAVSALNKTAPITATFADNTQIAKDSVVEIVITIGGTTPSIPAQSLLVFTYLEGGV